MENCFHSAIFFMLWHETKWGSIALQYWKKLNIDVILVAYNLIKNIR